MMRQLPAARIAPALPAQNSKGWLKGRMRATTPKGSRTEKFTASGPMGIEAPFISVTRPAKKSSWAAPASASAIISETGLPQSAASSRASSGPCWRSRRASSRRALARCSGGISRQIWKPAWAAATAASTSSGPASASWHSTSPEPGLRLSMRLPDSAGRQAPP